jgi:hypothetical protein
VTALKKELASLLGGLSQALQPHNLDQIRKAEIQQVVLMLERMKIIMAQLEIRDLRE